MKNFHEACLSLRLAVIIIAVSSFASFGAIYDGQEIELTQPDGTTIIVKGLSYPTGSGVNVTLPGNERAEIS